MIKMGSRKESDKKTLRQSIDDIKVKPTPSCYVYKPRCERLQNPQPKFTRLRGPAAELDALINEGLDQQSSPSKKNGKKKDEEVDEGYVPESYSKFAALYGGNTFTNEQVENLIKSRQKAARLNRSDGSSTSTRDTDHDNSDTVSQVSSKQSSVNTEKIKGMYTKNAAITGLLEQNIINLRDLKMSYPRPSRQTPRARTSNIPVEMEHPDIPNLMIHRFLVDGAPEVDGIDYTPDRLTVRDVTTPHEVLMNIPDESFEFVKPSSKGKVRDSPNITSPGKNFNIEDSLNDPKNCLMYKFLFPEHNRSKNIGNWQSEISENSEDYSLSDFSYVKNDFP